jgi:pilus assembly protein Flp/PilA
VKPGSVRSRRFEKSIETAGAVLADESGQGLGEYGLILGLVAAVCLTVIVLIGVNLKNTLTRVGSSL